MGGLGREGGFRGRRVSVVLRTTASATELWILPASLHFKMAIAAFLSSTWSWGLMVFSHARASDTHAPRTSMTKGISAGPG